MIESKKMNCLSNLGVLLKHKIWTRCTWCRTNQFSKLLINTWTKVIHLMSTILIKSRYIQNSLKPVQFSVAELRPHVFDLLFIVTCMHQKIKALFYCINFDYTKNSVKKCFSFIFFLWVWKKERKIHTRLNHSSKFQ